MPTIELTQGQRARVDWCDYRELRKFKWCAEWNCKTKSFYAARNCRLSSGRKTTEKMHRRILGLNHSDKRQVDHWNHDTLDNRRRNVRIVENRRDQSVHGVGVEKTPIGHFQTRIKVDGRRVYLGTFETPQDAQSARERFLLNGAAVEIRRSKYGTGIEKRGGRFRVRATVDGRRRTVGTFDTEEEAQSARQAFPRKAVQE